LHSVRFGDDGKARLVHGDLCPANVMVGRDGIVRLMDLGFSETARAVIRPAMEGGVMGTPGFLAPEQLAGRRATPATDVYAFGALLGQLLLGRPLFRGSGSAEVIERSLEADLSDLAAQLEGIHPGAGRIVQRAVTPARKGRILDGVLLVGEMFAVGLTDPADEVLARIVGEAMDVQDTSLVPRELVAADGAPVNIHDGAIGADATMYEEPSLDEPSYESGTYEDYSSDFPTPSTEYDPLATADADQPPELEPEAELEPDSDEDLDAAPMPSVELETAEEPEVKPRYESATVPSKVPTEGAGTGSKPASPRPAKKKGKGLTIGLIAAGLLLLIVCAGVSIPTVATLWLSNEKSDSYDGPTIVHESTREGAAVAVPAEVALAEEDPTDDEGALDGDEVEPGEEPEDGEPSDEDALAEEDEVEEEPTEEPEPLTEEELQRQREEEERRREEREERDRKRAEERAEVEAEAARVSREESLADAELDIDWGDVATDGDEDWLSGDSGGNPEDKVEIDIDALTSSAPEVSVPTSAPPKVRHTPIRSGRVDSTVSLKLTTSPNDSYTGIMYYRGAPGGSWASQDISGGENGKITAKLYLGSWVSDDHDSVEYYFLVDGPGGSSGAGTRLSPYSFVLK
jgi:serine/threonine protein kinase